MRPSLAVVLAVLIGVSSMFSQPVLAQPAAATPPIEVVLGDPSGDVDLTVAPRTANQHANASQYAGSQVDHLDLLRVRLGDETDTTFQVSLQIKTLDPPQNARPWRLVSFSYGRLDWQILVGGCPFPGQGQAMAPPNSGCLRFRDPGGNYRSVQVLEGSRADNTVSWTLKKEWIFNENRVPARWGDSLRNLTARAQQNYAGGGGFNQLDPTGGVFAVDVAPQSGTYGVPFVFQKGAGGAGHFLINAPDPIRVTNGEATTIVFKVELFNRHTEPMTAQLSNSGGEADWSVRVPAMIKVEGESSVSFPVILSLPFRHDHGKTALFTVKAESLEDPASRASTQLGVFWTDVPQPSGHHECDDDATCGQWFHSSPFDNPLPDQVEAVAPFKNVWFNGVEKDPSLTADDANVPAFFNDQFFCLFSVVQNPTSCQVPPTWVASWFFPMSPSLLMGLDFDISRQGVVRIALLPALLDPGARVEAQLRYCDPTKQGSGGPGPFTALSSSCYQYTQLLGSGSVTTSLAPGTQVKVEVPLKMESLADLLPYQRGANIGLMVRVVTTVPQNTIIVPPRIEFVTKQSHLHMPLLEYHDPIDQQFAELGAVKVEAVDAFEKPVNPGRTTVFRFEVINEDDEAHHLSLEVQGINADWARISGPQVLMLAPKQRGNFSLAVSAPDDAVAEERAELFVVAQSQEDASVVALSRLRATVVVGLDVPDEGHLLSAEGGQDSSSVAVLGLFAALLVAFVARRRRA